MGAQHGAWSPAGKQLVAKQYVVDYTSDLGNILVETDAKTEEFGAQSRKYAYGLQKVSAAISQENPGLDSELIAKLYIHHDMLGSVGFATDAATGAVLLRSGYDTWGREAMAEELSIDGESWAFTEYTVHTYDPVLGFYYAKARMYDAENRRFVAMDSARGNVRDPLTVPRYVYALDNPSNFIDHNGAMPALALNVINTLYHSNTIKKDDVPAIVLLVNAFKLDTQILHDAANNIEKITGINPADLISSKDIEEEMKDRDITIQSIFLAFHETAQVLASKELKESGVAGGFVPSTLSHGIPVLEEKAKWYNPRREVDIMWRDFIWEVKPSVTGNSKFVASLKKYIPGYVDGWTMDDVVGREGKIPGYPMLDAVTAKLFTINGKSYSILVESMPGLGKIGYRFVDDDGKKKTTTEMAMAYKKDYEFFECLAVDAVLAGAMVAALIYGNTQGVDRLAELSQSVLEKITSAFPQLAF
jgi:RHS repeat-associated protein